MRIVMVGRKYAEAASASRWVSRIVSNYNNLSAVAPVEIKETEVTVKSIDFWLRLCYTTLNGYDWTIPRCYRAIQCKARSEFFHSRLWKDWLGYLISCLSRPRVAAKHLWPRLTARRLKTINNDKKYFEINCSTLRNVKQFFNQISHSLYAGQRRDYLVRRM